MQTDNTTLLNCVNRCFALASDASIPAEEQQIYFERGDRLRARLMTLLHAQFAEGTQAITSANAELKKVNAILKERLQGLQNAANTVGALDNLVSIIDDLFQLPFTFV